MIGEIRKGSVPYLKFRAQTDEQAKILYKLYRGLINSGKSGIAANIFGRNKVFLLEISLENYEPPKNLNRLLSSEFPYLSFSSCFSS